MSHFEQTNLICPSRGIFPKERTMKRCKADLLELKIMFHEFHEPEFILIWLTEVN